MRIRQDTSGRIYMDVIVDGQVQEREARMVQIKRGSVVTHQPEPITHNDEKVQHTIGGVPVIVKVK